MGYPEQWDQSARPGRQAISWGTTARVALAVFAGTLAALIVFTVGVALLAGHALETTFGSGTDVTTGLSKACSKAIANGSADTSVKCAGQDRDLIQAAVDAAKKP